MEEQNIKGHYLFNILQPKLLILTKDIPTPSEFLLRNNSNDGIDTIATSEKISQTNSNLPYNNSSKSLQRFPESFGNQNKGYNSNSQTIGYNNHQKQRQTDLRQGRYNHYFKVPARDHSNFKERHSELYRRKPQKPCN